MLRHNPYPQSNNNSFLIYGIIPIGPILKVIKQGSIPGI